MLCHLRLVALLEVFYVYLGQDVSRLVVAVFEEEVRLHVLLLEESHSCAVLRGLDAFIPLLVDGGVLQGLGDPPGR